MAFGLGPTVFDVMNLIVGICKKFAVVNSTVLEFWGIKHIATAQVVVQDHANRHEQFPYSVKLAFGIENFLDVYPSTFKNRNDLAFDRGTSPVFGTTDPLKHTVKLNFSTKSLAGVAYTRRY